MISVELLIAIISLVITCIGFGFMLSEMNTKK